MVDLWAVKDHSAHVVVATQNICLFSFRRVYLVSDFFLLMFGTIFWSRPHYSFVEPNPFGVWSKFEKHWNIIRVVLDFKIVNSFQLIVPQNQIEKSSRRKLYLSRSIGMGFHKMDLPKENNILVRVRWPTQYQEYDLTLCVWDNHLFFWREQYISSYSVLHS